jgi:hypothetical protein
MQVGPNWRVFVWARETGFCGAETAASKRPVTFNRSSAETKPETETDVAGDSCQCRVKAGRRASRISEALERRIQAQLRAGKGILRVAREVGVGTGTVQRVRDEMKGPFDAAA